MSTVARVREVASQSTLVEAFRLANQPPSPEGPIRDHEDLHRRDWVHADTQVKEVLTRDVDTTTLDASDLFRCQTSARRLFLDIWNRLEGVRLHEPRPAREEV